MIAIVGPTATGKSDLAVALAQVLTGEMPGPAEVVNADAFQLYRGMDIGTAKLDLEARHGVIHHQIDVLDPAQDASVARYQESARNDLSAIAARGRRAVVVGGSGLYVRALLDEMEFPGTEPTVRAALEAEAHQVGSGVLHARLAQLDPPAAERIDSANTRRIVRALEVIEITGRPFSATLPQMKYVRSTVQLGLDCDRAALDARVAQRVESMWAQGLVEEVRALAARGMGRTARRAVGYVEILAHFAGELSADEAKAAIITNTRRLARKQMGWFGRDPRIRWLDSRSPTLVADALAAVTDVDPDPEGTASVRRSLGS